MMIDTHSHINFFQFDADRKEVIQRARDAGVECIINVGSDVDTSKQSVLLAKEVDFIYAAVGVHPHSALDVTDEDVKTIKRLSKEEKIVGIGEIGLDYFNRRDPDKDIADALKSIQKKVFCQFLELAKEKKIPVVIHCREAGDDVLEIVKDCLGTSIRGVMHCFSQDKQFLDRCLELGLYVSFTGNITYTKAQKLRDVVAYAPLDRVLIETDAPYLAPQDFRGKRNEPAYVKVVAGEIARIKNIDFEKVAQITTENARRLFKI
ncbi:MAG: TatD family hydrolase [Candidatus Omnitrophota bacterium]